jgi:hypothetical protein
MLARANVRSSTFVADDTYVRITAAQALNKIVVFNRFPNLRRLTIDVKFLFQNWSFLKESFRQIKTFTFWLNFLSLIKKISHFFTSAYAHNKSRKEHPPFWRYKFKCMHRLQIEIDHIAKNPNKQTCYYGHFMIARFWGPKAKQRRREKLAYRKGRDDPAKKWSVCCFVNLFLKNRIRF